MRSAKRSEPTLLSTSIRGDSRADLVVRRTMDGAALTKAPTLSRDASPRCKPLHQPRKISRRLSQE